jgi:hypothetical protein
MKVIFATRDFLLAELRKYEIAGMPVVPVCRFALCVGAHDEHSKKNKKLKIYLDTNATWR